MLEQLKGPYPYALSILHIIPGDALSQGEKNYKSWNNNE